MISFSIDPAVAEQQMHAIIYYLTAFGYVDGDFDRSEKAFIREYIGKLVAKRADDALDPKTASGIRAELVEKWTKHFHEELDRIDQGIQADFLESVAEG
ncbi:MAG TPA: serine/threonine protein phosphatase, partial [Polyangiaceae bacterium]|nr:serine/threonine protein phosphatase [Polyangiaceae bacterium]